MKIKNLLAAVILVSLVSCGEERNEDKVQAPSKDGAVEVWMSTEHVGNQDVMKATFSYWVKGIQIKKTAVFDTIPSLGTQTVESDEDDDGNTQKATIPKEYEFYITVSPKK